MQLISTFSFVEISTSFSVIEMYIKKSEISNFWLSILISQVVPYLMFILVSKSTRPVSLVLSSQNVQCFYISTPLLRKAESSLVFGVSCEYEFTSLISSMLREFFPRYSGFFFSKITTRREGFELIISAFTKHLKCVKKQRKIYLFAIFIDTFAFFFNMKT